MGFVFGLSLQGLLATSGIIAIVLGLALQSTLADVFSGISLSSLRLSVLRESGLVAVLHAIHSPERGPELSPAARTEPRPTRSLRAPPSNEGVDFSFENNPSRRKYSVETAGNHLVSGDESTKLS
jgi:hypothetical protein